MSEREALHQRILQHVTAANYQPVKPKVIARQLGLPEGSEREVRKAVKKLVKRGRLAYGDKHRVLPAPQGGSGDDRSVLVGVFRRAAGGFGFVRPDPPHNLDPGQDVFVPERKTLDAVTGDLVRVRVKKRRQPGEKRYHGEILEVVERESYRFVGVYQERSGVGVVQVDGKLFAQAILVGDAGAKNARPGDKVVIEMVRFPAAVHPGEGVLVEVLGPRGKPGIDTLSIIHEFNLPQEFPEEVLESARQQAELFDETLDNVASVGTSPETAQPSDRVDLSGTTVITIDPADARDFDDAISLEQLENGHWRLAVHIADVAHFVPAGSPLDDEARKRATSVYLPDRVIPMLPEVISNNLASLQPGRTRLARTAFIEMTAEGVPIAADIQRTVIFSDRRFTYEEVDEYLADREAWRDKLTPEVFELLGNMHTLAMTLRRRRMDGGAIELTLPEIRVSLDKDGKVAGAYAVEHTESHQIIEEFMLAANEAVATWLTDREEAFLRRVHGQPNPRKLTALTQFVRELGIRCESLESRFEIKRVLEEARGKPQQNAVHLAVLRSMAKAVYGPQVEGHYALNTDNYCHFTSPIRRYPDLAVHRLLDALARGEKSPLHFDQLVSLGAHCSDREQRAEAAERELIKLKLLDFLSGRVGEQMDAVITGVEEYGLFAQVVQFPADGFVHVDSLRDDQYRFEKDSRSLTGFRHGNRYRLGDKIRVEVTRVDLDRRELDFRIADGGGNRRPRGEAGDRGKSQSARPGGQRAASSGGRKTSDRKKPTGKKGPAKKGRGSKPGGGKRSRRKPGR